MNCLLLLIYSYLVNSYKNHTMLIRKLTLFLVLISRIQAQCSDYISKVCLFSFNNTDDQQCTFLSCIKYQNSTQPIYQWQNCIQLCCPKLINLNVYHWDSQIRDNCNAIDAQEEQLTMVELTIIILVSSFLLASLYVLMNKYYERIYLLFRKDIHKKKQEMGNIKLNLSGLQIYTHTQQSGGKQFSMSQKEVTLEEIKGYRFCCICLQGATNLQTQCKHQFHVKCLEGWLKRNKSCPTCRAQINRIQILCGKCQKTYTFTNHLFQYLDYQCKQCRP